MGERGGRPYYYFGRPPSGRANASQTGIGWSGWGVLIIAVVFVLARIPGKPGAGLSGDTFSGAVKGGRQ